MNLPYLGTSKLVTRWLVVTLVLSIASNVDGGFVFQWLSLSPWHVAHGQVWRLVTWALVEPGFWSLGFTLAAIYKFGGELSDVWGDRRLARFVVQIVLAVAAITTALTLLGALYPYVRLGGWAVGDILVIAWARQFPSRPLRIQGVITVNGDKLVWLTVGVAVVATAYFGISASLPDLLACAFAALYPREWLRALGSR